MNNVKALPATARTDFIDRLRVVLKALVIVHHTAITYGAAAAGSIGKAPTGELRAAWC